jgi:hypothetical protein
MAQHFLLSAAARSLGAAKIMRMSDTHGGVEMRQAGAMLDQLPLQAHHQSGELRSLAPQRTDDVRRGHGRSPS